MSDLTVSSAVDAFLQAADQAAMREALGGVDAAGFDGDLQVNSAGVLAGLTPGAGVKDAIAIALGAPLGFVGLDALGQVLVQTADVYSITGNDSGAGVGVYGVAESGFGVLGFSPSGAGVRGFSYTGTGVYGTSSSGLLLDLEGDSSSFTVSNDATLTSSGGLNILGYYFQFYKDGSNHSVIDAADSGTGTIRMVNKVVVDNYGSPQITLDGTNGTVTATEFVGGGAGITGVTASMPITDGNLSIGDFSASSFLASESGNDAVLGLYSPSRGTTYLYSGDATNLPYLQFQNNTRLIVGSFDNGRGGSSGISLICAAGYELNWQVGHLSNYQAGGYQPITFDSNLSFNSTTLLGGEGGTAIDPSNRFLYAVDGEAVIDFNGLSYGSAAYWFDLANGYQLTGSGLGLTGVVQKNYFNSAPGTDFTTTDGGAFYTLYPDTASALNSLLFFLQGAAT